MKIAFNYLKEVEELVQQEKIEIAYLKYPSIAPTNITMLQEIMDKKNMKILLHGLLSRDNTVSNIASTYFLDNLDKEQSKQALIVSKTPGISIHLGGMNDCMGDEQALVKLIVDNTKAVKELFPHFKFYTLENKDLVKNSLLLLPDVISNIIRKTEFGFLLDITHAYFAANLLQMPWRNYIDLLPLERIYEIHLAGCCSFKGKFYSHNKLNAIAFEMLTYVLKRSTPHIITIEYGEIKIEDNYHYIKEQECPYVSSKIKEEVVEQIAKLQAYLKEEK